MKILLVTESYWPNADGGALFERRLAHGLAGRGNSVSIWAPGNSYHSYMEEDSPTIIYREKSSTLIFNRKYRVSYWPFWSARRAIRRKRPDVIHVHNAGLMGLSALFWAKRYAIPVVATNHFMPENALLNIKLLNNRFFYNLIWQYLIWFHNRCDFVTSPTPTAVELLVEHGLKSPHKAISNGIDLEVFHPGIATNEVIQKYKLPTDRPIVLYLGRVDGEKRIDVIITAFPQILRQVPALLLISGAGVSMNDIKKQAHTLGVADKVIFTGYIDERDKPALYNASDVFVMSSPAELQSIVMLEAMACGLPIVSVDIAALKELCHDGENGYLFQNEDSGQMAAAVVKILKDKPLAANLALASQKIVKEHHSTVVTFSAYEAIYQQALRAAS